MILLDTHVWIPWSAGDDERLSVKALAAINKAERLGISAISCWETAMLVSKNRLKLSLDVHEWIQKALGRPKLLLFDLDVETLVLSTRLPGQFHGDPADRMIAATALLHNIPLITKDRLIQEWGQVKTIW